MKSRCQRQNMYTYVIGMPMLWPVNSNTVATCARKLPADTTCQCCGRLTITPMPHVLESCLLTQHFDVRSEQHMKNSKNITVY
jgi:hypothetical protein